MIEGFFSDSMSHGSSRKIASMEPNVEFYEARRGLVLRKQWRWRIRADNGRIISGSTESYSNLSDAMRGVQLTREALKYPKA